MMPIRLAAGLLAAAYAGLWLFAWQVALFITMFGLVVWACISVITYYEER